MRTIISGGQTGADRGGLDAAIELGLEHGGWCPRDRRAEDGRIPDRYQLRETPESRYEVRTERNVLESDGTAVLTFGPPTGGSALTIQLARRHHRPLLCLDLAAQSQPSAAAELADWVRAHRIQTLNVAGPRESGAPGIAIAVREVVVAAARLLNTSA